MHNVLLLQAVAGKNAQIIGVCPNNANTKKLLTQAEIPLLIVVAVGESVFYLLLMENEIDNIFINKNVFKLTGDIIPKLLNHALYMQSITFPSFKEHISDDEFKKKADDFNRFLELCQSYLAS